MEPLRLTSRQLRRRGTRNVLRMGHCAPSVVQTLLDAAGVDAPELVRMAAGLPGGIGNSSAECGGVTGSLLVIGLRHARDPVRDGLPATLLRAHDLVARFVDSKGTLLCRDILGHRRVPIPCVRVVRDAPCLCAATFCSDCATAIAGERADAYRRLFAHYQQEGFHCAHAVFAELGDTLPVTQELLDATAPFAAGTAFMGMTCSAFTAGVIALGVALGRIENSRLRVLRLIATMAVGGDAFRDDLNEFNASMNRGHRLAEWFTREFGSTQCRAITGCDFSTGAGVRAYIDTDGVARCRTIARRVATTVREIIEAASSSTRT